jgi:hypothetical protein
MRQYCSMRWDALFADLEAQAAVFEQAERAAEVEERTRGELAAIGVGDRLRAGLGTAVRVRLPGGRVITGVVQRVGPDWLLLGDDSGHESVVRLGALLGVAGLTRYTAVPGSAGMVAGRLGLRSVLRGIARDRSAVRIELVDGTTVDATIDRVGADFVEVAVHPAGEPRRRADVRDVEVIPFGAVAAVRRRP